MSTEAPSLGFDANFSSDYSVILDHPIDEVFSVIGTSKGHERTTRLSGFCSGFELQHLDTVYIPKTTSLIDTHVRTLASSVPSVDNPHPESPVRHIDRQFFTLQEKVPVMFGLIHATVNLSGTLSWDEGAKVALYESKTDSGILVWKSRVFEDMGENKTRVSESIKGKCQAC